LSNLLLTSPGPTHADLVKRAALWLRNKINCRVVLTEQPTGSGEIPDAIAWKYWNLSYLVECKVSRSDFFADRCKPFRCDPASGMGMYRFFMAPAGVLTPEDVSSHLGWGLLEVRGRNVRVLKEAEPQSQHNHAEEVAQLVQAVAMAQANLTEPFHEWITGPESAYGKTRAQQRESREEMKTRTCTHHRLQTAEEEALYPDAPRYVYCPNLVATGHYRCSEHGGKTRGLRHKTNSSRGAKKRLGETKQEHIIQLA
jgi:hypothetical protein